MIHGRLIDRKAIVPVIFRLPQQPDFSLNFVVDTGFNLPTKNHPHFLAAVCVNFPGFPE